MKFRHLPVVAAMAALLIVVQDVRADEAPAKSKFDQLIDGKKKVDGHGEGLWTMYHSDQQLLVELPKAALGKEYIVLTSIARGISSGMVIGGMTWGFGDDVIWTFKQSGEKLFVIHRNVRYKGKEGSPEARAVELAYSDSVIYSLPILTTASNGNLLVDMTKVFMSDDQQIGQAIGPGFSFAADRSTWAQVKAFKENVELEVAAVYSGRSDVETVPDSRGVSVNVHYSISELPKVGSNGYKPRLADDRIGYFLTVSKDFSKNPDDEHFVRYINRWNLEKLDPNAELSPPKEPIIFYIEKTVPVALRPTIEAGILEWNKAFEKIGFANAIRVQHEEDAEALNGEIDPEDVRYNFFRWITADAGFAMGPSRVDPRTGEILDADIIFDSGFLNSWKQDYETFTDEDARQLHPNWTPLENAQGLPPHSDHQHCAHCLYSRGMQQQMGFAAALMTARGDVSADGQLPREFVHQGLKEVVMHEVGHTLGLRHNFKASTWKSLEDVNKLAEGQEEGIVASVMDYAPPNIHPEKDEQGLYYSQTIGPYDYWAIEYGYKPLASDEAKELAKIASRSGEPGLDYATDEDTRTSDSDPLANRFDLGKDPITFVKRRMEHSVELMPKVIEKTVQDGEGYQKARQAFGLLMSEYWRSAVYASRFPGGVYVHRDHKGDKEARQPFVVVEADKQREAMKLLVDTVFTCPEYDGSMLNYLAASRWSHWGQRDLDRLDYPIHDITLRMQRLILSQILDDSTLQRLLDNELKVSEDEPYTLAEHLRMLTDGVFTECLDTGAKGEFTADKPYIGSFRRNLQRETLKELADLVTHGGGPEDARTLARMHLQRMQAQVDSLLKSKELTLDDYSKAHLLDSQARIKQVLAAQLTVPSVN
jgi:hypothetical protein